MLQHILKQSKALKTEKKGVINIRRSFGKVGIGKQPMRPPKLEKVFSEEIDELEWEMLKEQVTLQRTITETERD